MKYVLGISCEHDSGAALVSEGGQIIAVVNEERLVREKLYTGFPESSIRCVLETGDVSLHQISTIAVGTRMHINEHEWDWEKFSFKRTMLSWALNLPISQKILSQPIVLEMIVMLTGLAFRYKARKNLRKMGFKSKIFFLDHHIAHLSAAIHTSGFKKGLSISFDAQGDGWSSKVCIFSDNGREKRIIFKNPFFKSLAHYYGYATKILGFVPMRHEGKVTGLAARGNSGSTFSIFHKRLFFDKQKGKFNGEGKYGQYELNYLKNKLKMFSKEDIAAGIQKHLEFNMVEFVKSLLQKYPEEEIALSGGIFANVLLNQKISALEGVTNLHIHPNMGDGGLAFGAAVELLSRNSTYSNKKLDDAFLGPDLKGDIDQLTKERNLSEIRVSDTCRKVAELIRDGRVIAVVEGRMEYGPRALCHRSIICSPFDVSVNDWLNRKLRRTEFMPFAPVTLDEDIDRAYYTSGSELFAMEFMTITCTTKDAFRRQCPAANHVDNTARPQIAFKTTGRIYEILKEFKSLTGCSTLINTSFNMHEEPIVNTIEHAIDAFLQADIDYIILEGRLFFANKKFFEKV